MTILRLMSVAATGLLLQAGSAQAHCGHSGSVSGECAVSPASAATYGGRYAQKPGCCANAPVPTSQRGTVRYIYSDGVEVVVYSGGRRTGRQPFEWWAVPPH